MLVKVRATKDGFLKPLKKVEFPHGQEFVINIPRQKKISLKKFLEISKKSFGIMKDEDWDTLIKKFNKDFSRVKDW